MTITITAVGALAVACMGVYGVFKMSLWVAGETGTSDCVQVCGSHTRFSQ